MAIGHSDEAPVQTDLAYGKGNSYNVISDKMNAASPVLVDAPV